jgi:hypothetical protein
MLSLDTLQLDANFLIGLNVSPKIDLTKRATSNFPSEPVLIAHARLHYMIAAANDVVISC